MPKQLRSETVPEEVAKEGMGREGGSLAASQALTATTAIGFQ